MLVAWKDDIAYRVDILQVSSVAKEMDFHSKRIVLGWEESFWPLTANATARLKSLFGTADQSNESRRSSSDPYEQTWGHNKRHYWLLPIESLNLVRFQKFKWLSMPRPLHRSNVLKLEANHHIDLTEWYIHLVPVRNYHDIYYGNQPVDINAMNDWYKLKKSTAGCQQRVGGIAGRSIKICGRTILPSCKTQACKQI